MLHAALRGEPKERVLSPDLKLFGDQPLREPVAAILTRDPEAPPPASDGGALAALELARLSLAGSADFREGALMAVNFGGDADVIGAVYGQLAGAHYGLKGIPRSWRQALAHSEMIVDLGDGLLQSALVALGDAVAVT
jgi:ADP-ribosyl-[dinitrogen reductase] hydrolase